MKLIVPIAAAAFLLAACGPPEPDPSNPNADNVPSTDLGAAYPSQVGQPATVTPGAEGGRSSATTGATDGVDNDTDQTTPP